MRSIAIAPISRALRSRTNCGCLAHEVGPATPPLDHLRLAEDDLERIAQVVGDGVDVGLPLLLELAQDGHVGEVAHCPEELAIGCSDRRRADDEPPHLAARPAEPQHHARHDFTAQRPRLWQLLDRHRPAVGGLVLMGPHSGVSSDVLSGP